MSAAIAVTPTSGNITSKVTVVRVDVTGASSNDSSTFDTDNRPSEDPFTYYLLFDAPAGTDDKRSYAFNVSQDGKHTFNNFVFDAAGSWTVRLRDASDDSDVATAAVTVS